MNLESESDFDYDDRLSKLLEESLNRHNPLELHFTPYQYGGARNLNHGSYKHSGLSRNKSVKITPLIPPIEL